jgi:nucleotide-binding universal stress UspA family protein
MKTPPPIVAAVDFSSSSDQVLAHGAKLAGTAGCSLIAAHVVNESRLRDWAEATGREAATAERVEETIRRLDGMVAETCEGVNTCVDVRIGRPYQTLAEIMKFHGADLLILGAHDVAKKRLGSVASRCARSVPADVLILRDWQGSMFRRIAACVDFSQSSAVGLERAIIFANAYGASLEIIHVVYPPTRDPWGRALEHPMDSGVSYESMVRDRARQRLDDFLKPYAGRLSEVRWETTLLEGESPAAAITAHVDAREIDLTVTGSQQGSWLADFVLGSNAERLLHDSNSSVLLTRGHELRG